MKEHIATQWVLNFAEKELDSTFSDLNFRGMRFSSIQEKNNEINVQYIEFIIKMK